MPSYNAMTKSELRAYVVAHPIAKSAFRALVDRLTSEASPETFDLPNSIAEIEEVETLTRQKLEQLGTNQKF